MGSQAVRVLFDAFVPVMSVMYEDSVLHERAVSGYLASIGRQVSLVDRVSFELMRDAGLDRAFAFDHDFVEEGFAVVP